SLLPSLPLALLLALRAARSTRRRLTALVDLPIVIGFVIPSFWIGILLVLLFSVKLRWLPASGYAGWHSPVSHIRHLVLPTITLALPQVTLYYRYLREGIETALRSQFVRTARAKGMPERVVLLGHALPNALIPALTVLGMQLGTL